MMARNVTKISFTLSIEVDQDARTATIDISLGIKEDRVRTSVYLGHVTVDGEKEWWITDDHAGDSFLGDPGGSEDIERTSTKFERAIEKAMAEQIERLTHVSQVYLRRELWGLYDFPSGQQAEVVEQFMRTILEIEQGEESEQGESSTEGLDDLPF